MKSNKELLEQLMFTVNEKAKQATSLKAQHPPGNSKSHFYHGQYLAYSEIYTLLKNQLKHES